MRYGTNMKRAVRGTVVNGAVHLLGGEDLPEGQQVIVVPLAVEPVFPTLPSDIEQEDIEFVRACRGRLGRLLKAEDGGPTA